MTPPHTALTPARQAMESRVAGVALATISAAGFSTLGLFAKLIYAQGFSVPQALAWRFSTAAIVLWSYMLISGTLRKRARKLAPLVALGMFGFAPQAGLYFATVRVLDPGITSLLLYLYPSFVVLFSALFLKRFPKPVQVVALVLSIAGCALTFWKSGHYPALGLAMGVLVAVAYGGYLLVGERALAGADSIFATTVIMTVSAFIYWIASLVSDGPALPSTPLVAAGIVGIALCATILPIVTLFAAIKRIGAPDASLVSTIEPVLTVALSSLLLGERMGLPQAIGGCLIVAAVVVLNLPRRKVAVAQE